ncbi:MAG: GH116 family glycosyl hydrolase [Kiritimatiellae bacterium]|nr:GH116 family glycosyl hydrolase [Kiritimatiellia bacterium]MDD5522739.1 GH116 family glycosyl hydrolase [Kiritimatiellia bacterium]
MNKNQKQGNGCSSKCSCHGEIARRDFLKIAGAGSVALLASQLPVMAGPFPRADFDKLVPADKKLDPTWVKSLFERGKPEVLTGDNLKYIGMPIGGICTGQVYFGGDGRLWHWDIFNKHVGTGAGHYANPPAPDFPFEQGFAIRVGDEVRSLDCRGFSDISFRGEYPIGLVNYRDGKLPVDVSLEAFSPYVPLNTDDSSLPATVMNFIVKNTGNAAVDVEIGGWLENAICLHTGEMNSVMRRNRVKRYDGLLALECTAEKSANEEPSKRADIVFDNFEKETYEGWTVEGDTFSSGPVEKSKVPSYQGELGNEGKRTVNSHSTGPGNNAGSRDDGTGKLISREFKIERKFIGFFIGGGDNPGKTCLNLMIGGKVAASATGKNDNKMRRDFFDVRKYEGKTARLEIVDAKKGGWGNIGVDFIVFTDIPGSSEPLEKRHDYGLMSLALLDAQKDDICNPALPGANIAAQLFPTRADETKGTTKPFGEKLIGALSRKLSLAPGKSAIVTFMVSWYFPNLEIKGVANKGRYYTSKFTSAGEVVNYVAGNFDRLATQTRLWRDTWYDSTLPYWLLDRVHLNTSILATSTCFRFVDGRFWAWEGVGCCAGTCGHVWQYAHAMARLFPDLERILREGTDFGLALKEDGAIHFRGENNNIPAIDAQAGTILRVLREHQMSADDSFLKRIWPGVKKATDWLIAKDADGDGIIVSNQHNTLDTDWFGPVAWLSGLYLGALLATAAMAEEMGDAEYASKCRAIVTKGQKNIVDQLFDGEYFINKVEEKHLDAINSGTGCEIDQVMGQSWAFQVGLPRVFPEKETKTALQSLWKYNFSPDVGPYRERYKPGRWYAMAGEAGLLMCSFPRNDWDYDKAKGKGPEWAAGYFNECMNGFEYQAASHMVWEGMLQEGLAVTRAVHDRYHASRRNPYNEVECGDHYARSMAVYGVFIAACGFEYHGPKGYIAFAPRLTPENFKAPFTSAEGWGTFEQRIQNSEFRSKIAVKYGKLRVKTISLAIADGARPGTVKIAINSKSIDSSFEVKDKKIIITLADAVTIKAGECLDVFAS